MIEVVNDPDLSLEAPDPSRAVTRPYVFDPGSVEAEWAAWRASKLGPAPDEAEAKRIAELHRAIAAVSLPAKP